MLLLANSKEAVEYLTHGPFFTGFNGMFDWNFIFGILMIIGGGHPIVAYIVFPLYLVGMLVLAQIIDTARQHKPTSMQKLFKIKPTLLEQPVSEEAVAQNA
nr:hypothetical protein [Mycoplasmopsis bovis]